MTDFDRYESLAPAIKPCEVQTNDIKSMKNTETQTYFTTHEFLFKTTGDFSLNDSRMMTPFPEILNSSGMFKKPNTSMAHTAKSHLNDKTQNSSKNRPASVIQQKTKFDFTRKSSSNDSINNIEGRYTPIGKLDIL